MKRNLEYYELHPTHLYFFHQIFQDLRLEAKIFVDRTWQFIKNSKKSRNKMFINLQNFRGQVLSFPFI
jgi:hypothetical protein